MSDRPLARDAWPEAGPGISEDLEPAPSAVPAAEAAAAAVDAGFAEAAVEADLVALEAVAAERDGYRELAQRVQADFENYRKQAQRRLTDEVELATARVVERLVPALDACEAAIGHGVEGADGIMSALLSALRPEGFEAMESEGRPFDPAEHEAVVHEPGDEADPVVVEVLRTGYRWKGRVLRPAMVKVRG